MHAAGPHPSVPAAIVALADHGLLVQGVDGPWLAERIRRLALPGTEAVATTGSVVVVIDPDVGDRTVVATRLQGLLDASVDPAAGPAPASDPAGDPVADPVLGPTVVEIPVRFDGPDLDEVAGHIGVTAGEVADLMLGDALSVAFLGFAPGFAYLTGLPSVLADLPRRPSPRARVPPGSVAVAGGYAAVYPQASPGGWNLLGSTDLPLFDRRRPPYAVLQPGQPVRFVAAPGHRRAAGTGAPSGRTGRVAAEAALPGPRRPLTAPPGPTLTVEAPGLLTTVQDAGRQDVAHIGVPRAGAADPLALRLANRLVGNADDDAALEVTVTGPCLRLEVATFVAVVGDVPVTLDGRPVPLGAPVPVVPGQRLQVGTCRRGARAVVAVAGGVLGPEEVGSRSSDLLCHLGPGPLRVGDVLPVGQAGLPAGHLSAARLAHGPLGAWAALVGFGPGPGPHAPLRVAVVPGPDGSDDDVAVLVAVEWVVQPTSDRVGVRLAAAGAGARARAALAPEPLAGSRGAVRGMVQVPPDGQPVVLLCDHATVGGYPVVATVAAVDVALVAQCRPGARVRLVACDAATARRRWLQAAAHLQSVVTGRYPAGTGDLTGRTGT